VPALQTPGQLAGWLNWRGFPIASPAALGKIKELFTQAVRALIGCWKAPARSHLPQRQRLHSSSRW
jgi:hypothetical protein